MLNALSWVRIGCEEVLGPNGKLVPDTSKPIFRCQQCHQCSSASDLEPTCHTNTCPVHLLLAAHPSSHPTELDGGDSSARATARVPMTAPACTVTAPAPPVHEQVPPTQCCSADDGCSDYLGDCVDNWAKSRWGELANTIAQSPEYSALILLTPRRTSSGTWTSHLKEADLAKELDIISDGTFLA